MKKMAMKLNWLAATGLSVLMGLAAGAAPVAGPWDQPAATLAAQIAGILGPGQAQLTIRNLSTISTDEVPAIRQLLEQDLKAHGVNASGGESASTIRITLSEDARERLWVAEVVEGSETQVVMARVELDRQRQTQDVGGLMLRRQAIFTGHEQLLAALEIPDGLVILEPEQIVIYARAADQWRVQRRVTIGQKRPLPRDPHGILLATASGKGFEAWLAGMQCTGHSASEQPADDWMVHCAESDDPWPILHEPMKQVNPMQPTVAQPVAPAQIEEDDSRLIRAFYNGARNYFTGIVTPSLGVDLPPFYSAALIPRPAGGVALLVNGIDGKVQLVENGAFNVGDATGRSMTVGLKPVAGTRDWGSDFAALSSGCGAGTQVITSGSGQAENDSLRAYELPALEAVPASAPLAMNGTVLALWTASDSKSVMAVLRDAANEYEVDRVTAFCN
ncbi:MAG TPA: hypothetical protein VMV39_03115 [Terracidiphilus sp.]|nr:hypothetical protein [Terracidiphilus sp.]